MFQRLLLSCLLLFASFGAYAADLGSAFDNLVSPGAAMTVNKPGRFQSAARNTFVAGGADLRFPRRTSPSLVSVTPPSLSAGCGGISAHFGGFSFISGGEIEQMIRSIAQNSQGMVISMAIKTLCPMCESVIQAMSRMAQQASKMSMDSCAVATNLANTLADSFGSGPGSTEVRRGVCAQATVAKGETPDWFKALDGACDTAMKALKTVESQLDELQNKAPKGPDGQSLASQEERLQKHMGNLTWILLNSVIKDKSEESTAQKLMLLNLLGTRIVASDAYCGAPVPSGGAAASEQEGDGIACLPRLEAKEAVALFMCGLPEKGADGTGSFDNYAIAKSRALTEYCRSWFAPQTDTTGKVTGAGDWDRVSRAVQLWSCVGNDWDKCTRMELVPLTEMNLVRGPGFAWQVNRLLREGARRVRANDMALNEGEDGQQLLGLIQAAPYPIYQAINAAAVYPAAADDLLDTMSVLVAEAMAFHYFDDFLRIAGRADTGVRVANTYLDKIHLAMGEMRGYVQERRRLIAQNIALQEGLNEQIRSINLAIQRQVLTTDMLNANRFAVSAGNPQAGGNSAAGPTQ
jgi:hypothetical protein